MLYIKYMNTQIFQINQVDFKSISYKGPFDMDDIGKFIYVVHNDKPLIVQTPTIVLGESTSPNENDILCVPLTCKTKKLTNALSNFFNTLDKKFMNDIVLSAKNLEITNDYKYTTLVNTQQTTGRDYVLFKLLHKNNFDTIVFDESKAVIPPSNYTKAFETCKFIKLIFEISALFVNHLHKSINVIMKVYQVKITELKQLRITNPLKNYSFVDSDNQNQVHDIIQNELNMFGLIDNQSKQTKTKEVNYQKQTEKSNVNNKNDTKSNIIQKHDRDSKNKLTKEDRQNFFTEAKQNSSKESKQINPKESKQTIPEEPHIDKTKEFKQNSPANKNNIDILKLSQQKNQSVDDLVFKTLVGINTDKKESKKDVKIDDSTSSDMLEELINNYDKDDEKEEDDDENSEGSV